MREPLENLYFDWLYSKVVDRQNSTPTLSYLNLVRILHNTEFVWLLSGDDNRAEDGKDLRREFLLLADIPDDLDWRHNTPCSILEMLIAFCGRAQFMTDVPAREWFWEFMENLELHMCNDAEGVDPEYIAEILHTLIWRTYDPTGHGGLCPLDHPRMDQRNVEIWFQFCDYLVDQNRLP